MIYAIGLDTDKTFINFLYWAKKSSALVTPINLRSLVQRGTWSIDVHGEAELEIDKTYYILTGEDTFFCRIVNLAYRQTNVYQKQRWNNLTTGLQAWLEINGRVVANRQSACIDNGSKPLHEHQLAQAGFQVPHSLTSSSIKELSAFCAAGPTINKTICGVRADCVDFTVKDLFKYYPERGPLHLQRKISGADIRVHVVKSECFAIRIDSQQVDYRVGHCSNQFKLHYLPSYLEEKIIHETKRRGQIIAGWDFKLDITNQYWALEVNPSPGYGNHDGIIDGQITHALIKAFTKGY